MAKPQSMQALWQDSYLASGNEAYLEDLYDAYLAHPQSVASPWRDYFDQLVQQQPHARPDLSHADIQEQFLRLAHRSDQSFMPEKVPGQHQQQERVIELIAAYRRLGHLQATIDPLNLMQVVSHPTLELSYYGFTDHDLKQRFHVASFAAALGQATATLQETYQALQRIYCRTIGFEYMHINRAEEVEWIRERIEKDWMHFRVDAKEKKYILECLVMADGLEKYLGFKFVGQKRFSLEGGDSLIPLLNTLIKRGAEKKIKEFIIGMPHRGRLNVLVNVIGKEPQTVFAGFSGEGITAHQSGDVKYHLGDSTDVQTEYGPVHLALAFNPSHLEIVAPVVQGSVRARQRRRCDTTHKQVLPIQMHGDAAFAGQGVVMETFNLSQTRWFKVGGSIHVVVNNQIGFTISDLQDARSTTYCTDVAKMVEAPILHVNGNDPEAVYFAALFAMDYRDTFERDVVIDLVCYRRQGHNEADEPSATQPLMYKVIRAMPPVYALYAKQLVEEGVIEEQTEKQLVEAYRDAMDQGKTVVEVIPDQSVYAFAATWKTFIDKKWTEPADTAVPLARIEEIAKQLERLPAGFVVQPQVKKILGARKKMTTGEELMDWGYAETMAYATLLLEGYPIRLCGQDSGRGTFAHRHAVLHDQQTDEIYIPLSHLSTQQAQINIVDSLLSEEAVVAFEYGYASAEPNNLVLWEAQFGDFANGAQVVIDQFISSGEQKWSRLCGLVMLLPHGYEGAGPEHSSARLERYLQLCAQENMQVCVPSTPAQMFHLLRRQMVRPYRKPLVVMTPKSLLRHPLAVSSLAELAEQTFHVVIPEIDDIHPKKVDRIICCTGKVFYELLKQRRELQLDNSALIRIEQLYPFPEEQCRTVLAAYPQAKELVWCQEEPQNQGAWMALQPYLLGLLSQGQRLCYIGRSAAAAPAVGYHAVHVKEQAELVKQALTT